MGNYFPALVTTSSKGRVEGLLGLSFDSILHAGLLSNTHERDKTNTSETHRQYHYYHHNREAFLHAICHRLENITFEVHLSCLPNVGTRARGMTWFSLFLRATGTSEERVKERLLNGYLTIWPLLAAYFPEMEFSGINRSRDLKQRFRPFKPNDAVSINRRHACLSLSAPLKQNVIGFGIPENSKNMDNPVSHFFPWVPPLNNCLQLIKAALWRLDPIQVLIRFRTANKQSKKTASDRLSDAIHACEYFMAGLDGNKLTLKQQAHLMRDISVRQHAFLSGPCFRVGVYALSPSRIDSSMANIVGQCVTSSAVVSEPVDLFRGGFSYSGVSAARAVKPDYYHEKEPMSLPEAAGAILLPYPPEENIPGLSIKRNRTSLAILPESLCSSNDSVRLFNNEDKGHVQSINIGIDERMRHMFVVGQTGTGKSTLMENLILQDIRAGRGVAVIDPHGDMVDNVIGKMPYQRQDDVILFDLLDRHYPVGFNVIEYHDPEERDLIIDDLYQSIDRLYDLFKVGGPLFEMHFRSTLKLLMGDRRRKNFRPTLLDFPRCYSDDSFRSGLKKAISDKQILEAVKQAEETTGEAKLANMAPYITSKLSRFYNDVGLKRIVGQKTTAFDFNTIMNNGKIFLVKLGRGRFGATVSGLLANQLVSRFKMAAMKRGDMPPEQRRDFFLYVDECHTLPTENFMDLLSEARKFRLGLVLATQYTAQLKNAESSENNLLSAILGNVGSIIMFRLGQEDAYGIARVLEPCFSSQDIISLPNWQGYARLQSDYGTILPFSFKTQKDSTPFKQSVVEQIVEKSRRAYGRPVNEVDDEIYNVEQFDPFDIF